MDKHQLDTQSHPSSISKTSVDATAEKETASNQKKGSKGETYLSDLVEERAQAVVNLVGYSLLIFSLFDYLHIIIPPQFTNFIWEFQTIGTLVEHVAVPLIGLAMVFYRPEGFIGKWEKILLGLLSWVCLLLGVLYILMVPLGITDTWRIYNANQAEASARVSQKTQPLQQLKTKLVQAKTNEQLQQVFASLTPENRIPQIDQPQKVKDELLAKISQSQKTVKDQADLAAANQRKTLLKNSLKWNLGALVAGVFLICIWRFTDWARIRDY